MEITKSGKCVIYVRTSTKNQNIDNQEMCCKSFAKEAKLDIKAIFNDKGISGQSMKKRDGLKNALNTLEKGDILLVRETSRLSRDMVDKQYISDHLKIKNCYLVSYLDKIGFEYLPDPSIFNEYNSKSCYIYAFKDSNIDDCINFVENNNMTILDTIYESNKFTLSDFEKILKKIKPNDFVIVPTLQIMCNKTILQKYLKQLKEKKAYIHFNAENICTTTPVAELVINTYIGFLGEIQRTYINEKYDHILHPNNILKYVKLDESSSDSDTNE